MARDRFGYGTEGNSTMGKLLSGQQVPFSEKLIRKSLGEDETNYMRITEKIGEENVKKLTHLYIIFPNDSSIIVFCFLSRLDQQFLPGSCLLALVCHTYWWCTHRHLVQLHLHQNSF